MIARPMTRKRVTLAFAWLFLLSPSISWGASFDCAQAHTLVEHQICDLPQLSAADDALAKAYATALSATAQKAQLRKSQRDWLKKRDASEGTAELVALYRERVIELNVAAGRPPNTWATVEKELRLENPPRRVVLEKGPSPEGDFTLSVVVSNPARELGRFELGGNTPLELEADLSSRKTPIVVASSKSCGASCSSLHVTVVAIPSLDPPRVVLAQEYTGGSVSVEAGRIIVDESVYSEDDASCCPSRTRVHTFTRRGDVYDLTGTVVKPR